jgi:membrane glycosyltransferase
VTTIGLLAAWLTAILVATVPFPLALLMLAAFLVYVPSLVIWFWNALFGCILLTFTSDPLGRVIPEAATARNNEPIVALTAIVITVRNGDPVPAFARLRAMKSALDNSGFGGKFHYAVLSDSTLAESIAAEERAYTAWRAEEQAPEQIFYRRRVDNAGFKHGNLHDFCERRGDAYQFMVVLDEDSLMTAAAVVRLVRIMQSNPRFGILQTLPVGLPAESLFSRIFQFGHSHNMQCFTFGGSWWHGDCCRPRGHNYAVRVAQFTEYCWMPELPGAKTSLQSRCEDAVEAAFMYRAGCEVRFLPDEFGSYEGYPPTLLEYLRRQNGWCHGDMQNLKILNLDIAPLSRFHLLFVAQKYFGAAAIIAFVVAAAAAACLPSGAPLPAASALALYIVLVTMYFAPRLFGISEAALRAGQYGGLRRLLTGSLIEIVFAFLLTPTLLFAGAMSLLALAGGRNTQWDEQWRGSYQVSWRKAWRALWPPTAFGVAILVWLAAGNAAAIPWFLPFLFGLILSVPLAVFSTSARLGAWAAQRQFCALPDEIRSPPEMTAVFPRLASGGAALDD